MFTYLVQVSDSCKDVMQNVDEIRDIIKEVINTNVVKNSDQFKNILDVELDNALHSGYYKLSGEHYISLILGVPIFDFFSVFSYQNQKISL